MGVFAFIKSLCGCRKKSFAEEVSRVVIDLTELKCGESFLRSDLSRNDFFTKWVSREDIFRDESSGFEIGVKNFHLDYMFIDIKRFPGSFRYRGKEIDLCSQTTEADIANIFGEAYWRDEDDDELVLFFEDTKGEVEIQFEFPGKMRLGFVTVMSSPVLADPQQRQNYGITKNWPPE